jgi:hypothetical protein
VGEVSEKLQAVKSRMSLVFICLMATLVLPGCEYFFEAGGDRALINSEVLFVREDGTAVAGATVYLVERVGTMHPITETLTTDPAGRVFVKGYHCLPMYVAMDGGAVVIGPPDRSPSYRVVVRSDQASVERMFGRAEEKFRDYSRTHTDCG